MDEESEMGTEAAPVEAAPIENVVLAEILNRDEAVHQGDRLLAAIVDFGVFVPVGEADKVVFVKGSDGSPLLPGYTSAEVCAQAIPQSQPVLCDGARIQDIARQTGVEKLMVATADHWAAVPTAMIMQVLHNRGMQTAREQSVRLTRSAHPLAIALRDAMRRRILEFPGVEAIWIADAHWQETGLTNLMLHVALTAGTDPAQPTRMLGAIFEHDVKVPGDAPQVSIRTLDPKADAQFIARLMRMGLDLVNANHKTGKVGIVSVDYDS
ncbi:MAG TPA: hypothetical protein VGM10_34585 [Actinocrinis sp.]